jgi:hypothetical protein
MLSKTQHPAFIALELDVIPEQNRKTMITRNRAALLGASMA